jgi:hypothetical protein
LYSLYLTNRTTGTNVAMVTGISSVVAPGNTYAVSGWVLASEAANAHFTAQIDCATAADEYPWIPGNVAVNDVTWTYISGTLDMNNRCAGDSINAVNLYLEGPGEGVEVWLDDVVMTLNE